MMPVTWTVSKSSFIAENRCSNKWLPIVPYMIVEVRFSMITMFRWSIVFQFPWYEHSTCTNTWNRIQKRVWFELEAWRRNKTRRRLPSGIASMAMPFSFCDPLRLSSVILINGSPSTKGKSPHLIQCIPIINAPRCAPKNIKCEQYSHRLITNGT